MQICNGIIHHFKILFEISTELWWNISEMKFCITGKGQKTTISPSSISWEVPITFLPKILFQLYFLVDFRFKALPFTTYHAAHKFFIFFLKVLIFYSRWLISVCWNSFLICCSFVSFSWSFFSKCSAYLTCNRLTCANIFFLKFWSC